MGFGSFLGSVVKAVPIVNAVANAVGASSSAKKAKRAAEQQRNWEEEMSDTAHQREVADLNAAGLNEILSANSGASTPQSAIATTPELGNYGILEAINSALTYDTNKENAQANTTTAIANTLNAESNARTAKSTADLNNALKEKAEAEKLKIQEETGIITPKAKAEIKNINSSTQLNKAIREKNITETTTTKGKGDFIYGTEVEKALKELKKQKANSAKKNKLIEKELYWAKDKAKRAIKGGFTPRI